ncbi:glycosyltransferase family 4 protein [Fibrella aquatilis]|uniref:Glycosyltransferase family 4 protein n=1 Tax=Fibrella aquatilis TaxID=2817059 RepID=A0A939GB20_9BACT|nr:glycosyltransferase family 4 protein [Fibrella aquatilis]MBO0933959.1 glycosyltransferase family 4 protein [Fibrella aquatilis]
MKRILFFTPFGGRTGSEMLLWNIIKQLDNTHYEAIMYADQVGSMKNDLPRSIPFHTSPYNEGLLNRTVSKVMSAAGIMAYERRILAVHNKYKPDFWYLNTIMMAHIAKLANRVGVQTIAHVSEMPYVLYEPVKKHELAQMLEAKLVFGLSKTACKSLKILGVASPKLLYPSIDLTEINPDPRRVAALRKHYQIPDNAFVWGMSGSLIYRKGIDYLPQLASRMKQAGRTCYFLWMGGGSDNAAEYYMRCELAYYGHTNVILTGALKETYYEHMALMDAFLLLSHEETFGMVNIEAAYLGKPIITFDSGGVTDIMTDGMGKVVSSWDVDDFATAMIDLMDGRIGVDPAVSRRRALDFAPDKLYKQWDAYMSELN